MPEITNTEIYAKESPQVKRARRKLDEIMRKQNASMTPDKLLKASASLQRAWERHSSERIDLTDRDVAQVTQDGKTAALSDTVQQMYQQLSGSKPSQAPNPLAGRVQKGFSSDT